MVCPDNLVRGIGKSVNNKYKIGHLLDKGSFGSIYMVNNILKKQEDMAHDQVIKFQNDYKMLADEIHSIVKINKKFDSKASSKRPCIPKIIDYGLVIIKNESRSKTPTRESGQKNKGDLEEKKQMQLTGFYVMPKYKMNLE